MLDRQLLLERQRLDVAEAVRRVCALQAQAPASPHTWRYGTVCRTSRPRISTQRSRRPDREGDPHAVTLRVVHAEEATDPTGPRCRARCGRQLLRPPSPATGMAPDDADAPTPELGRFSTGAPRTGAEVASEVTEAALRARALPRVVGAAYVRAAHHAPTGGPWSVAPRRTPTAPRRRPR